jgi:predicted nucleic-acid-binding protein
VSAPGEKITLNKLPNGRIEIKAARPTNEISWYFRLFEAEGRPVLVDRGNEPGGCRSLGRQAVKITADTNVLVRTVTGDDARQSEIAQTELAHADVSALALPALCELVWVLTGGYKIPSPGIAKAIRRLINSVNVVVNRPAVEAGLAVLDGGGDFADSVIDFEGGWLGAETFV